MGKLLPAHPNLDHLKHEAKQLLQAHRQERPEVCAVLRQLRRFGSMDDRQIAAEPVKLYEVQYALAMEYGFKSWNALRQHVKSLPNNGTEGPASSPVNPKSLWTTIDLVNEAFFEDKPLSQAQRQEEVAFIIQQQGKPRSYRGMFGPIDGEVDNGLRVFTGERVTSSAGSRHILGQEACRALLLLDRRSSQVQQCVGRASEWLAEWIRQELQKPAGSRRIGVYCCPTCTCALWRRLDTNGKDDADLLELGIRTLSAARDSQGAWRGWPLRYTLLALSEMNTPAADAELRYAARRCKQELARRISKTRVHSRRWHALLERVLARV